MREYTRQQFIKIYRLYILIDRPTGEILVYNIRFLISADPHGVAVEVRHCWYLPMASWFIFYSKTLLKIITY